MRYRCKYLEIVWLPMARSVSTSTNADVLTGLPNTYLPVTIVLPLITPHGEGRRAMPDTYTFDIQSQVDQLRPDLNQAVSEYVDAPGGGGSVTRQVSATCTWTLQAGISLSFGVVNSNLGGSYSESRTFGDNYIMTLLPGERARIAYTPNFRVVNALVTETSGGDIIPNPTGNSVPTQVVTDYSNQPATINLPIDGGHFHLDYDGAHFYTDSQFRGTVIRLAKGDWDWGSIPNDAISSLRVPNNYTVEVFTDTHFQGASRTFGPGDYNYVGDDWNDQISSIKIS
jgi:hypothetical protein